MSGVLLKSTSFQCTLEAQEVNLKLHQNAIEKNSNKPSNSDYEVLDDGMLFRSMKFWWGISLEILQVCGRPRAVGSLSLPLALSSIKSNSK